MSGILDALNPTTITNYIHGEIDSVLQNNPSMKLFREYARIEHDQGGDSISQPIEAGRHQPFTSAPGQDISGQQVPHQRWARWTLQWSQVTAAHAIDLGLLRRNSNDQALVKIREKDLPAMARDIMVGPGTTGATAGLGGFQWNMLNNDADSTVFTGTGLPVAGLPTLLLKPAATGLSGYDGSLTAAGVTGSAPAVTDKEAIASTVGGTSHGYGTLSLALNGITGVDGVEPDAWCPTLVNNSATIWSGTPNDQANAVLKYWQYAAARMTRFSNDSTAFRPSLGITALSEFINAGNKLDQRQTVFLSPGADNSANAFGTGFSTQGKLWHGGVWWMWEKNMPAQTTTYLLNFEQATLFMQPLFHTYGDQPLPLEGDHTDPNSDLIEVHYSFNPQLLQWIISYVVPGQVFFHPRYQCRIDKYS